jgi:hypothetical protein
MTKAEKAVIGILRFLHEELGSLELLPDAFEAWGSKSNLVHVKSPPIWKALLR